MAGNRDAVIAVDIDGNELGTAGSQRGYGYITVERADVTWFVPEDLVEETSPERLRVLLSGERVRQIDLLPPS